MQRLKASCAHDFETEINTDWTQVRRVPTPRCLQCGAPNPHYEDTEENRFYREFWDLEYHAWAAFKDRVKLALLRARLGVTRWLGLAFCRALLWFIARQLSWNPGDRDLLQTQQDVELLRRQFEATREKEKGP